MNQEAAQAELSRAEALLHFLAASTIDTLTVKSLRAEDAPFLALIVSKLSPIIGNLLEQRILELIEEGAPHGLRWRRQDPDFPDVVLQDREGQSTGTGYKVKAWYALSTEMTGRFRESYNLLVNRNVRVAIVAWIMSHVVYGSPLVIDILSVDAASVAEQRDRHYHKPPLYLIVEPRDTTERTRNLQQTNVNGFRIQESSTVRLEDAARLVASHPGRLAKPHTAEAQVLNAELMNRFAYRLDTNFAKVDRIDHPEIERFKASVLDRVVRGRKLDDWSRILGTLSDASKPASQEEAARLIRTVYGQS